MRHFTSVAFLATGCLLLAAEAAAQAQPQLDTRISFDLLTSSVERDAAEEAGVATQGYGLQVNGSVTAFRVLAVSLDLGVLGLKDERQFRQNTTQGEKSSSIDAGMFAVAVGLRTPPLALDGATGPRVSAGVNAGYTGLDIDRTIAECVDCHNEELSLRAGSFLEPALHMTFGRGGLSARYRLYNGESSFQDALMIGYSWGVGSRYAKAPAVPEVPEAPVEGVR
ncbi:MAG TPA: hypothetical protein VF006_31325 [Longimicrobium sp.]